MDGLNRIWATWRQDYVSGETGEIADASQGRCVLCSVLELGANNPEIRDGIVFEQTDLKT